MIMAKTAFRGATIASLRNLSVYKDDAPQDDADLLNMVPDVTPDLRTAGQVKYMEDLITNLTALDSELGAQAREYTDSMTERGSWTPGRDGNASRWIDRLIAKLDEVRAAQFRASSSTANIVMIAPGRYAITEDGEVKCYEISYGRDGTKWAGFIFLDRISSDNRFPIKSRPVKARILAEISKDVTASEILAGITLRQCRKCGRALSDTKNPYFEVALGPECGAK